MTNVTNLVTISSPGPPGRDQLSSQANIDNCKEAFLSVLAGINHNNTAPSKENPASEEIPQTPQQEKQAQEQIILSMYSAPLVDAEALTANCSSGQAAEQMPSEASIRCLIQQTLTSGQPIFPKLSSAFFPQAEQDSTFLPPPEQINGSPAVPEQSSKSPPQPEQNSRSAPSSEQSSKSPPQPEQISRSAPSSEQSGKLPDPNLIQKTALEISKALPTSGSGIPEIINDFSLQKQAIAEEPPINNKMADTANHQQAEISIIKTSAKETSPEISGNIYHEESAGEIKADLKGREAKGQEQAKNTDSSSDQFLAAGQKNQSIETAGEAEVHPKSMPEFNAPTSSLQTFNADQTTEAPDAPAPKGDQPSLIQQTKTFLQITEKLPQIIPEGSTSFKLKLLPDGLGEITVNLICKESKVTLEIITSVLSTQKLLEGQAGELRAALEAKNYEVTGFNVSTNEGNQQSYYNLQEQYSGTMDKNPQKTRPYYLPFEEIGQQDHDAEAIRTRLGLLNCIA
ncbi:MAG: flagellar hook-length control protein FliK [Bacillota bacterium]|jgi:hypothetical protein